MTNQQFEQKRFQIVKNFFKHFNILDLTDDLDISISSSTDGIYHVFSHAKNGTLIHQYSISDKQLQKLSESIRLSTIKKLFIDTQLRSLEKKQISRNEGFNPLDFEQMS